MSSTRTLTINAAFFQDIKSDSVRLRELLDLAAHAFQDHGRRDPATLVGLLRELRDQLAMHFSLEECLGYFEDAIVAAPRLSTRAEALRSQHDQLYVKMTDLAEDAERVLYREPGHTKLNAVAARFESFFDQLMRHEEAENELIMLSMYEDLGTGD